MSILPSRWQVIRWWLLATCIGVIIHEYAHESFARARGLEVHNVKYFGLDGGHVGLVEHGPPRSYADAFFVSAAPFLLNTTLGLIGATGIATALLTIPVHQINWYEWVVLGVASWFTVAVTVHAPLSQLDVSNIYSIVGHIWKYREPGVTEWVAKRIGLIEQPSLTIRGVGVLIAGVSRSILAGFIWIILKLIQLVLFVVLHSTVVISLPVVILLDIISRSQRVGGHIALVGGVLWSGYYITNQWVVWLLL
jgi:hypothetical protein